MDWIASLLLAIFVFLASIGAALAMSDASPWEFWAAKAFLLAAATDLAAFVIYGLMRVEWQPTPKLIIAALVGLIVFPSTLGSVIWVDYRQDRKRITTQVEADEPRLRAIQNYDELLRQRGQHDQALTQIIAKYQQLVRSISLFESLTGRKVREQRLAAAEEIINDLEAALNNIEVRTTLMPGGGLIIRTSPNAFRVIFAVPMRVPPAVQFSAVPQGSTPNVIDKSTTGLTVIFTPPTIAVDHLPPMMASAEL
jgi:hypothetical protein